MTITIPAWLIFGGFLAAYISIGVWFCCRVCGYRMDGNDPIGALIGMFWPIAVVLVALWGIIKQFRTMYKETSKKREG